MKHYDYQLQHLRALAELFDSRFRIPGTQIHLGLDAIIGLIPGIGDTITTGISFYILGKASQMGVPFWTKCQMVWNIFIDWLIGLIPLFGDIFDIGFKANIKNLRLIEQAMVKKQEPVLVN